MSIINSPGWNNTKLVKESKSRSPLKIFNRIAELFDKESLGKSFHNNIMKVIDSLVAEREPYNAPDLSGLIYDLSKDDPKVVTSKYLLDRKLNEVFDSWDITDEEIEQAARVVGQVFAPERYGFEAVKKSDLSEFDKLDSDHPQKYDYPIEDIYTNFGDVELTFVPALFDPEREKINGHPFYGTRKNKTITMNLTKDYPDGTKISDVDSNDIISFRLLKTNAGEDPNDLDIDRSIISTRYKDPTIDFSVDDPEIDDNPVDTEEPEWKKLARAVNRGKELGKLKLESVKPSVQERQRIMEQRRLDNRLKMKHLETKYSL